LDFYDITSLWVFLLPIFQMKKDNHCTPYKIIWLLKKIFTWWYTRHLIMYQLNDLNMNLCHPLHLGIFQTVFTLSKWKLFMGLCLYFVIMVLLEMIRTNYSVHCQNQNGENTLMTGFIKAYNPKCLKLSNYWFTCNIF
jgi:hypothetical protein